MSLPSHFEFLARKELRQAACWLEADRKGRGEAFTKAVQRQVSQIARQPDRWPIIGEEDVRQSPVTGWDYYSIYYRISDGQLFVVSVFHASHEPKDY